MRTTSTNRVEAHFTAAKAIEALVAIATTILASTFVVAAVLPHLGSALIG